jgi:hypothetical protein
MYFINATNVPICQISHHLTLIFTELVQITLFK